MNLRATVARMLPHRIAGQLTLLMIFAIAAMFLIVTALVIGLQDRPPSQHPADLVVRYGAAASHLDRTSAAGRLAELMRLMREDPALEMRLSDLRDINLSPDRGGPPDRRFAIARILPGGLKILGQTDPVESGLGRNGHEIVFGLRDGTVLLARMSRPPPRPPNPFLLVGVFLTLSVLLLVYWTGRYLTAPLRAFSQAVQFYGTDGTKPNYLSETGPEELKAATRAFNRMQARIDELVENRTRTLTAISHDLRTPLTRLRLRSELIADETLQARTIADIQHMEDLLGSALTFLRIGRSDEATATIEISSFLYSIASQFEEQNVVAGNLGQCRGLLVEGRSSELSRAIGNLLMNALAYAGDAVLQASVDGACVRIEVADHGPGIGSEQKERMMSPFVRGDTARTSDQGAGFGLGLAISASIARAHGGSIDLNDTPDGGLTATLVLPIKPPQG